MKHDENSVVPNRSGVFINLVEAVVALILLIIGIVVIVESRRLGAGWTSDGFGAGYFFFFIGVIIAVSSAGILHQALFGKHRKTEIFVDTEQLKRVMSVLIPVMVYVLVIAFLGLYIALAIYIALFMIVFGKYFWLKSVIAAVAFNTLFFFLFEVWFKVSLYKGSLDPLRFLGY